MSSVKLQGGASGAGSVALVAPNTNSVRSLTLPDFDGLLIGSASAGTAGQVLTSAGPGATPTWTTISGTGTVTSVDVSGGTTGLSFSGGPVTSTGTITMSGTLAVANGGTGATTASGALTALGAVAKAGDTMTGDLAFSGTGRRIRGTFGATPVNNRTLFQTSIANDSTTLGIIPNGTGVSSYLSFSNSSAPDNAAYGYLGYSPTSFTLVSTAHGSGTKLPIDIDGRIRVAVDGAVGVGIGDPKTTFHVYSGVPGTPVATGTDITGVNSRFQSANVAIDMGVYNSGACFMQTRLVTDHSSMFTLALNPLGGTVQVGTSVHFANQLVTGNSGTATTINFSAGQKQALVLTANCTISMTFPGVGNYQLLLAQDATGGRTVTWAGSVQYVGSATAPAINTVANSYTMVSIYWNGNAAWLAASKVNA